MSAYKRDTVGFVWQQKARNLLPYLSALENVELPMTLAGVRGRTRRSRALDLLESVGLQERIRHRPDRLSGGEQQRTAIAVALANQPRLLLADEPTGEVDSAAADTIFGVLRELNQKLGVTVIVVTHDAQVARRVDRVVAIRDGRTATEIRRRRDIAGHVILEEEFALLDRVGRLQIPAHYIESLGLKIGYVSSSKQTISAYGPTTRTWTSRADRILIWCSRPPRPNQRYVNLYLATILAGNAPAKANMRSRRCIQTHTHTSDRKV